MADTVEMQDIRGLDIDKAVKGFALVNYVFKGDCTVSSTTGDSIRWYQEASADLTATAPSQLETSPLSIPETLEVDWTRNTSYVKAYKVEGFISMEDIKSADIDVLARSLLRLTRAIVKKVDSRIYAVETEQNAAGVPTPVNIQTFDINVDGDGNWNEVSGAIVRNLLHAKYLLQNEGYNPEGASLYLNPIDHKHMLHWLIDTKGSNIPIFSSEKIRSGTVTNLLGLNIKVSNNALTDYGLVIVPQQACTWKTHTDTTGVVIKDPGIGSKIRVWEIGEAILTDPKAVVLMTDLIK